MGFENKCVVVDISLNWPIVARENAGKKGHEINFFYMICSFAPSFSTYFYTGSSGKKRERTTFQEPLESPPNSSVSMPKPVSDNLKSKISLSYAFIDLSMNVIKLVFKFTSESLVLSLPARSSFAMHAIDQSIVALSTPVNGSEAA